MTRARILMFIIAVLTLGFIATGCGIGNHKGSATLTGVRYSDSLASGGKFKGCIQPGQRITTTDNVYWLPGPQNQRQDLYNSDNSARDHKDMLVTTKDGVQFYAKVNVNFSLPGDCKMLDLFMRTIGLTRGAYFEKDAQYKPGWITAMDYYLSTNIEKRFQTVFSQYDADQLYPSTKYWNAIGEQVLGSKGSDGLEADVTASTNGNDFYTNLSVDVFKIYPNTDYATAINDRQEAKTKAQTALLNQQSQVNEARSQAKIAKAQQAVTKAQIGAFPNVEAYLKSLVIAAGGNPFQPSGTLITPSN